jgi:class 3 adenylate cyclase
MARLVSLGVREGDSEEERLKKAAIILAAALIAVASTAWVITYSALGLYLSAAIPGAYQLITVVSLISLARGWSFRKFTTLHLSAWLMLPFLLQLSLGGFVASSGVILWSLTAALGALVFAERPIRWFVAYAVIVLLGGLAEPLLEPAPVPDAVMLVFFVLNIGTVSGVIYFLLRYFMRGLALERERSEALLLNVLPASTARRLKAGEEPIADRFDEVAVLFADVVDFTPISEALSPDETVEMLDRLFTSFDELADRLDLEKIKTIGDAYMAVSGLNGSGQDAADAAVAMALGMLDEAARMKDPIRLRVGLDIGPVTAGVIGKRKFAYDLWGDTVNTASRMESHGVPGRIQVTERAYQLLRDRYRFEPRGAIEVKGKGTMSPYLLVGPLETANAPTGEILVETPNTV